MSEEEIIDIPVDTPETPEVETSEIEVIDTPEAEPTEAPAPKQFDPKKDRVEFNTPEQQAKFDDVYKQMKQSDNRNRMLNDLLAEQQKQLDEIKSRFSQSDEAEAERILTNNVKLARDAGDDDAYDKAIRELARYEARKIIDEKVNKPPHQNEQMAVQAEARDTEYVTSLMSETDSTGQPVRPWLNEGHPEFNNALNELQKIAFNYVGDPAALQKSLTALDGVMREKLATQQRPKIQARTPNPMQGGNLTNIKPDGKIKMTRQEMEIAKKLGVDPKKYAARRDEIAKGRK